MKISPVKNSVSFGYNEKLNKQLKDRLKYGHPELNSILSGINDSCNETEDLMRELEKSKKGKKTNAALIDCLTDYFIEAKTFLASAADSLFPELNYSKIEIDTYKKEIERRENRTTKDGYVTTWRSDIVDAMEDMKEKGVGSYDSDPLLDKASEKDPILEKFTPFSYSPKNIDDVVGLQYSKDRIKELVIFPLKHPKKAKKRKENYGIEVPNFILLYGPPGCGKTMLAEAISAETGCEMYNLNISRAGLPYINVTTTRITKAFKEAAAAAKRNKKPVIVFMDEADSFLKKRTADAQTSTEDTKVVNTLLPLITQARENNVIVIAATNMFDTIDPAAKRRADLSLYIGLPDKKDIQMLLKNNLSKFKMGEQLAQNDPELDELSTRLKGYSPSMIVDIIKAASEMAYKEKREVQSDDIKLALKKGDWSKINEQEYLPDNKKSSRSIGFENPNL